MAQLAIKGHATRGSEVIALLEMLGGKNIYNLTGSKNIWYILSNCTIEHSTYLFEEKGFTLEEFLKEFPYKVGDKVTLDKIPCAIKGMYWDCDDVIHLNNYEIEVRDGRTYAIFKNQKTKTLEKLPKFKEGNNIREKDNKSATFTISYIDDSCYYCDDYVICNICDQDNWELVPNKFDINTLKPFDKVLVRDFDNETWEINFFSKLLDGKHFKCLDLSYVQCIPYEGNEHLFNTTNKCDEYYKTWEK